MLLVDSHAHFDGPEYDTDRDAVVLRARSAGVRFILNVGTGDPLSGAFERAFAVAEQYEGVYAAAGVHPHDAKLYDDCAEERIKHLLSTSPKALAWGEIGLDYHYEHSPRDTQRKVFTRQLHLARELQWPVLIHSRAAAEETIELLQTEYGLTERAGIMHCFGGGLELAQAALELGFLISFAGNLTFKNAANLREVAQTIPLDRLLVETDCPYLTPVPYRGKRNEPARVAEVAAELAKIHGLETEALGARVTANFLRFFRIEG